jgi:hypothetical protein
MADLQTMSPQAIIRHVKAAGCVERAAVEALRKRLNDDWVISIEEAEWLFQINQQVADNPENCPSWPALYVEAISRFVVMDMESPGEVSASEAEWLRKHIPSDPAALSAADVRLLNHIRDLASNCCGTLEVYFAHASQKSPVSQPLNARVPMDAGIEDE